MNLKTAWKSEESDGCEYLIIEGNNVLGNIICVEKDKSSAFHAEYKIELDEDWVTKKCSIQIDNSSKIELFSDGKGNWFNADGETLEHLKGAIDVDISATPFSNSLPINRLQWTKDSPQHFQMVYISVPSLVTKKVPQSYTYIGNEDEIRYFKYRSYDYKTVISVDSNGLVVDYPNAFSRLL